MRSVAGVDGAVCAVAVAAIAKARTGGHRNRIVQLYLECVECAASNDLLATRTLPMSFS